MTSIPFRFFRRRVPRWLFAVLAGGAALAAAPPGLAGPLGALTGEGSAEPVVYPSPKEALAAVAGWSFYDKDGSVYANRLSLAMGEWSGEGEATLAGNLAERNAKNEEYRAEVKGVIRRTSEADRYEVTLSFAYVGGAAVKFQGEYLHGSSVLRGRVVWRGVGGAFLACPAGMATRAMADAWHEQARRGK